MTKNIKVSEIVSVFTAYHREGDTSAIRERFAYGLSFTSGGKIVYRKDGVCVTEDSAHAVLLPMGETYSLRCTAEGHFPLINFKTVEPLGCDIIALPFSRYSVFSERFHCLREAFFAYGSTARAMSILYDILDELSCEESKREPHAARLCAEHIMAHFHDPSLSIEALAEVAGVSDAYLRRVFKDAYGTPPKVFLQGVRIKRAKELLSLGFPTVGEVAAKCGFASIYHFCRAFKSETGLRPKEYARRYPAVL